MRQKIIEQTINKELSPIYLWVVNESHKHSVPKNSETHFKIVIVSDSFLGSPLLKRHRLINKLLFEEFSNGLHALALHTFTEKEWSKKKEHFPTSPPCQGGSK